MLSALLLIPLVGAVLVSLAKSGRAARTLALITAGVAFVWTAWLLSQFDLSNTGLQFSEYLEWAKPIGLSYSLGTDGLSTPLLALNAFLTGVVVYSSSPNVPRSRLYYALILLVNAGVAGAFLAQNLLLFVLFFELELIPVYLLIAIWGGERRGYAAMKFLLYTALSGILILAAFLGVAFLSGSFSFDYDSLATESLSQRSQLVLLTVLLVGLGIKIPLVPLHTWSPDAYVEASPPVAILLGGILAKLGTYGLIRFGVQMFPDTWSLIAPGLAVVGAIGVMYGSLNAIAQKDIKRMVAYSSIGHMGYVLVAAAAGTDLSILGAVAQMIAHGLILALLFNLVGIVEAKVGTRELSLLNGLMNPVRGMPLVSGLLVTAGMASAGIPGLVGFAAEFIVFQGSFTVFPIPTLICILSSGLTAVYFAILLNRTCFGKLNNELAYYDRVSWSERIPALVLTGTILFFGLQPNFLIRWMKPTTTAIATAISPTPELIAQAHQQP